MLGELLDPFYPSIQDRAPLSGFYVPGVFVVLFLGYALGPGPIRSTVFSLVLFALVLVRPAFTVGSTARDYNLSAIPILWFLIFLDLGTTTHPRYVGKPTATAAAGASIGYHDLKTWPQTLRWAGRLSLSLRGVGWDWQVKNVPANPDRGRSRRAFVGLRLLDLAWHSVVRALAVYGVAFFQTIQPSFAVASPVKARALDVVINWCGGVWNWHSIALAYVAGAIIAVSLGISEPWECPPMLDSVSNAWSVRQMWSSAYHQMLRRLTVDDPQILQQPGLRICRLVGIKKGTLASRYLQLYLAFFISFGIHWWQQYTITRRDKGEFAFFMSQPVIITFEDFIQWLWGKAISDPKRKEGFRSFELLVGYVWTFVAFTFTMHPYVKGMTSTGVIGGNGVEELASLWLGQQHGAAYLQASNPPY